MTTRCSAHQYGLKFEGARFGALCDLNLPIWRTRFDALEQFSNEYLKTANARGIWPEQYPWPVDCLHCNTRIWEYPYVCDAIESFAPDRGQILDVGSALTFMPPYLASLGYDVLASDCNERMKEWADLLWSELSNESFWPKQGSLLYTIQDITNLKLDAESMDIVTNISVLEHLPMPSLKDAVANIQRVLKPDGLLVCTFDCWVDGPRTEHHHPLDQEEFIEFMQVLTQGFIPIEEPQIRMPCDLLTNIRHPANLTLRGPLHQKKNNYIDWKKRLRKAIRIAQGWSDAKPLEWCAFGITLRKRSVAH